MSLLKVRDLKVHFPVTRGGLFTIEHLTVKAVDGVNFDISPGETLGLVGESGCGKSTTARAVMGLIEATGGSVRFDGEELIGLSRQETLKRRHKFQMVFQNPFSSLNPRMTIGDVLEEPLRSLTDMGKSSRKDRIRELLEIVNLNAKFLRRYPHEFSGGQRQRINIARALAVKPELMVLDEPVSALDVSIQAQIINLLQDLQQRFNVAYLFIAHDLSVVKTLSHRVAVMYLGKIVEFGQTERLYAEPRHPYTRALLSSVPVPDPDKEAARERIPLEGEIPSPVNVPQGCSFNPRCPIAEAQCRQSTPPLEEKANHLNAACFLTE